MQINTRYITMVEVVKYLSLSEGSIRKLIKQKSFPHVKVLRKYLFNRDDVDQWVRMHSHGFQVKG